MKTKPINGFERYEIRDDGAVYDTKRNAIVCTWVDAVGYKQCYLKGEDGKRYSKRIHRLLALAYIPNPNNLPQVNHIDGNKLNNNLNNLEWVSNSTNTKHGYDNGLYKFKTRSYAIDVYNKVTHTFIKTYRSIRSMCEDLGINRKTVTMILKGDKTTNNYNYDFEYSEIMYHKEIYSVCNEWRCCE